MEVIAMFKWLETFKVVYETKNFSKASEILFISQPTVSALSLIHI
ncbi:LysR family transcriptional regulator, partial [Enterococcus sp. S181_ASV_20]|nr:LysR family transcriptional regulator [Enterococcus sp. S181_ASV_20]